MCIAQVCQIKYVVRDLSTDRETLQLKLCEHTKIFDYISGLIEYGIVD
jgi:hypothetical protein